MASTPGVSATLFNALAKVEESYIFFFKKGLLNFDNPPNLSLIQVIFATFFSSVFM